MKDLPADPLEYLNQRLTQLGITDELNTFTRVWQVGPEKKDTTRSYKFFDADEEGNIQIHYFNLNGQPYQYKKEGNKWPIDFVRKRLRVSIGKQKYHQEKGSGNHPFFNPGILNKYKQCKEAVNVDGTLPAPIETLYVVEGEFKSFKGWMAGLDIIGIPSIHGFYNGDIRGKMHEDIQELIITCGVKKIVLLMDADVLTLTWDENKDLHKRAASFYGSIKAFRESLQLLLDDEKTALELCYFMHINTKFCKEDAKGLDDLLCKFPAVQEEIINDIRELNYAKKYFMGFSILDQSKDVQGRIQNYLGLFNEQDFWKTYQDYIGLREFKFKRKRYIYDNEKKEVVYVRHEDTDKFMRIGPDWVKVITKINKWNEDYEEIVPWKISEIVRDYAKKYPGFIDDIQKYDDFINEPNFNGKYQRVIKGCFNLVEPLKWTPAPGSIASSVEFLKHIFGGHATIELNDKGLIEKENPITGDPFTVALDYLTILFKNPKHMLPVPILVSPENGTGKSTFLKWLQVLFGSNMCILGNDQFKMKFNMHYISKFIISIDEGFLEVDKKAEKERLKQLATADTAFLEGKGMNVRQINYYGKLIICSNDADRVMKIEDGESRWFVVKVPVATKKDPDLELKLKNEAAAWVHFLQNRSIHHPRVDRLWFKPEWFITDQYRIIVETTKNRIDRVFEDWIREQFMLYKYPVLRYSLKYLAEIFNDSKTSKYKLDAIEIKAYLEKKGLTPKPTMRIKIPTGFDLPEPHQTYQPKVLETEIIARPYEFEHGQWLLPEHLEDFKKPLFEGGLPLVTKNVTKTDTPPLNSDDLPF